MKLDSGFARLCCVVVLTSGCYRGTARDAELAVVQQDRHWIRVDVPLVRQRSGSDCGTAALSSVLAYWGHATSLEAIDRGISRQPGARATAGNLELYARSRGLVAYTLFADVPDLEHELEQGRPVIVGVAKPYGPGKALAHFEVVIGYEPLARQVLTLDPARGVRTNELRGFLAEWQPTGRVAVIASPPGNQ